jgi:hypothetical protein
MRLSLFHKSENINDDKEKAISDPRLNDKEFFMNWDFRVLLLIGG